MGGVVNLLRSCCCNLSFNHSWTDNLTCLQCYPLAAQFYNSAFDEHTVYKLTWCTTNIEEQYKCQNFTKALERDRSLFEDDFYNVTCKQGFNSDECVLWIDRGEADVTTLDAGEVFNAGRYHSLVPLMQEAFEGGFKNYYAVAVVKKDSVSDLNSLYQLRGKKACFAGVGSQAGWTIPIHTVGVLSFLEINMISNVM